VLSGTEARGLANQPWADSPRSSLNSSGAVSRSALSWFTACVRASPPSGPQGAELLGGILWVASTGSSWREMPEEYGKWERAHRRYELWVKQDLWRRILRMLGEEDLPGPAMKKPN
jgi:hypothetical protein